MLNFVKSFNGNTVEFHLFSRRKQNKKLLNILQLVCGTFAMPEEIPAEKL